MGSALTDILYTILLGLKGCFYGSTIVRNKEENRF